MPPDCGLAFVVILHLAPDRRSMLPEILARWTAMPVTEAHDTPAFKILEKTIIPRLFEGKDASGDVRIWVPGCATGEAAYSLAIILREHIDTLPVVPKVQIFASDIDEVAIAIARTGRYPATLLEGMSPDRRARFFIGGTSGYAVQQRVRELCTFSTHA
jgi:two-component system CheB/CheR fusion protein